MIKSKKFSFIFYVLVVSTILMTFTSMTSFLFPIHTGVDQNCFFTVGKSMLDGRVLYRDIFEQKGPLLYFIHMVGALISRDTFIGVYLLQIINMAVLMYYFGKISDLFLSPSKKYIVSSVSALFIVISNCFSKGDNAEEFCMTFLAISIYHMLLLFKDKDKKPTMPMILFNGILAGCILMIKFSMLGFHIAWVIVVGLIVFNRRSFGHVVLMCFVFLGGMALVMLPFVIYFMANGALDDFFYVYFYSNIFLYSKSVSVWYRIKMLFGMDIFRNFLLTPISIFGFVWFYRSKKFFTERFAKGSIIFTFLMLYTFVFIGGTRYKYYLLITGAFVVFGVISLVDLFEKHIEKLLQYKKIAYTVLPSAFLLIMLLGSNIKGFYFKPTDYYAQVKFAEIINQTENPTLLNYNFLDGGFFLKSETPLPDSIYFCKVNIPRENLPEMYIDQENSIVEKETDYVITRTYKKEILEEKIDFEPLYQNYELISTAYEGNDKYTYYLFKLK